MAKTGAFYFLFEKRSQKTFRAERFRKCLESYSVLCFLLSVVYDVFLHLQYFIEEIKSCSGVLLLTQFFFFRFFNLFILWMYNKALNVWSLGKLVSFVFPRFSMFPSTSSRETSIDYRQHNCSALFTKIMIKD